MLCRRLGLASIILITACIGNALAESKPRTFVSLPPSLNFASSPNPVGSGARATAWGQAFIAVADDATASSWNPAGLIQLERPEMSAVGILDFRREVYQSDNLVLVLGDQGWRHTEINYLSISYPFEFLARNFVMSISYQRMYDFSGEVDATISFSNKETTAEDGTRFFLSCNSAKNECQKVHSETTGGLSTVTLALAVELIPSFSLGIALNVWPGGTFDTWTQKLSYASRPNVLVIPKTGVGLAKEILLDSSGEIVEQYIFRGFNIHTGFFWTVGPRLTIGGSIRTPFSGDVNRRHISWFRTIGMSKEQEPQTVEMHRDFHEKLEMHMPLCYGLGLAFRFGDELSAAVDVYRTEWSMFSLSKSTKDQEEGILAEGTTPVGKGASVLSGKANATTQIHFGAEYLFILSKSVIALRGGMFYDPEPAENNPDNFFGFAMGSGVSIGPVVLDVAYTLRYGRTNRSGVYTTAMQHRVMASSIAHF